MIKKQKKIISIICAIQPKPNPGMSSVDLAFFAFANRNFPDAELHFLKICAERDLHKYRTEQEQVQIRQRMQMPFKYENFNGNFDKLYRSDLIVFWGDFFHMAHYRESEAQRQLKLGNVKNIERGLDLADNLFFLAGAPSEVFKKTIIYGENLLFNKIDDYAGGKYTDNLKTLLMNVENVWMRDVFSALTVSHVKNNHYKFNLGMDCSFFLRDEDLVELKRNYHTDMVSSSGKMGVFFHRNSQNLSMQLKFARELAIATGCNAQWFPWRIDRKIEAKKRWNFRSLEIIQSEKDPSEGDLFDLLKNYKFIISDTYHVCVNAWRLGTPAICIGACTTESDWDVSTGPIHAWRDKRWVFYSMIEALVYYVHADELKKSRTIKKRVSQLTIALARKRHQKIIMEYIYYQRDSLEEQLIQTIQGVLNN